MRKLLKEISAIPGVAGSCIFDKQDGAVCTEAEADLSRSMTEDVGIHFVRLMQMGTMNQLNITSAHFRFERYAVVALPLEKGAVLLAVCDANANCSLVATTAAMLAEDMSDELARPAASAPRQPDGQQDGGAEISAEKSALQEQLTKIEDALATAIGPVAGMVVSDYFEKWRRSGPAESTRLPELIDMLTEEVGDARLIAEFKRELNRPAQ